MYLFESVGLKNDKRGTKHLKIIWYEEAVWVIWKQVKRLQTKNYTQMLVVFFAFSILQGKSNMTSNYCLSQFFQNSLGFDWHVLFLGVVIPTLCIKRSLELKNVVEALQRLSPNICVRP